MKIWRSLAVMLVLAIGSVAGAGAQDFRLLAFDCIEFDSNRAFAMQFERETFPPFTDTGLFVEESQQLLYVEQGRLTFFSDQLGQTFASDGFSYLAPAGDTLGLRNDDLVEASLLWLRLTDPRNASQATRFAAPGTIRSLWTIARARAQAPRPLFVELELPAVPRAPGYLFIGRLDIAPASILDTSARGSPLTTTGVAALIVDAGTLQIDDLVTRNLLPGEATLIGTSDLRLQNHGQEPALVFLIGFVTVEDEGWVMTAIKQSLDPERACPSS